MVEVTTVEVVEVVVRVVTVVRFVDVVVRSLPVAGCPAESVPCRITCHSLSVFEPDEPLE